MPNLTTLIALLSALARLPTGSPDPGVAALLNMLAAAEHRYLRQFVGARHEEDTLSRPEGRGRPALLRFLLRWPESPPVCRAMLLQSLRGFPFLRTTYVRSSLLLRSSPGGLYLWGGERTLSRSSVTSPAACDESRPSRMVAVATLGRPCPSPFSFRRRFTAHASKKIACCIAL